MSKHLQGPLQVGYEFDETGYPLFVVAGLSGDQKRDRPTLEATAKLFAAAPKMYEWLDKIIEEDGAVLHSELIQIQALLREIEG
jgi:hypothetical protein